VFTGALQWYLQIICPSPSPFVIFHKKLNFYDELLAPRPVAKLEDNHLAAFHDCLFNMQPPCMSGRHLLHLRPEDGPCHGGMKLTIRLNLKPRLRMVEL
jgi:hypothetical protein